MKYICTYNLKDLFSFTNLITEYAISVYFHSEMFRKGASLKKDLLC